MSNVIQLRSARNAPMGVGAAAIDQRTVDVLRLLLDQALDGQVVGFVYGAISPDHEYFVEAVGEARCNPTFTRGVVAAIDDYLAERARQ